MRSSLFNDEEVAWLREEVPKWTLRETVALFNEAFGRSVTYDQLRFANARYKYGKANRSRPKIVTDEELDFLRELLPTRPRVFVRDVFYYRFDRKLSLLQLDRIAKQYDLRGAPNTGRLQKGHEPHNKGKKGWNAPGCEKGWFPTGNVPANRMPLWSERWSQSHRTPCLEIKVPGPSPLKSHRQLGTDKHTHWVRKAVWVWEQANGPVPEGHVVVQLDGDPANCELDNLDCVPKAVVAILNQKYAPPAGDGETNKVRVRLAQVRHATGERRKSA